MKRRLFEFLFVHGRLLMLFSVAVLSLVVLVGQAVLLAKWAAAALLMLSVVSLWADAQSIVASVEDRWPKWTELFKKIWPFGLVAGVTLWALGPITRFEMPVSQDHVNHYFGTHVLVHEMIPSGRIFGWTDSLGTGYPFGDIYHIAGYFLTGGLHLLTAGLVPLDASYAFGILATWLMSAMAVTAVARRVAGPYGAAFAGILFVLDPGGDREGGWGYAMFHGVWTQRLSLGVWLFALLALYRLAEKQTVRRFCAAGTLVGLSLWTHPMNGVTLLIAGMVMLGVQLYFADEDKRTTGALWQIGALVLGGLIGLFWMIRMIVNKDVVYAFSSTWKPVSLMMENLLSGTLFDHQWVLVGALFLAGAVYVVVRGERFSLYAFFLFAAILIVGSMDLIITSDVGLFGGGLSLMQYRRFSIPAKPFYFALAGAGLSVVGRGIIGGIKTHLSAQWPKGFGPRLFAVMLIAPLLYGLVSSLPSLVRSPVAMPLTNQETGEASELLEIRQVLASEKRRCGEACTAVFWEKPGHGGLYPVIAFADLGYRWLPMLRLPANNFDYQGVAGNVATMSRLGASVVVSKWPQSHKDLKLLGHFGTHYIYRLTSPEQPQVAILGKGEVRVISNGPEEKRLKVAGVAGRTTLVMNMAPYKKWHAIQKGRILEVTGKKKEGVYVTVIEGVQDGTVLLQFDDMLAENILYALGGFLFVITLAGMAWRRPLPSRLIIQHQTALIRVLRSGFVAMIAAAGVGLYVGGSKASDREWLRGEGQSRIVSMLHHEGASSVTFEPENVCVRPFTRDPHFDCAPHDLMPRLVPGKRRHGRIPSCLAVGVERDSKTNVRFDIPKTADRVKGMVHLRGKKPVDVTIQIGEEQWNASVKKSVPFVLKAEGDSLTVSIKAKGRSEICLEAVALLDRHRE